MIKQKFSVGIIGMLKKQFIFLIISIGLISISCNNSVDFGSEEAGSDSISVPLPSTETLSQNNLSRDLSILNTQQVATGVNVVGKGMADANPDIAIINFSVVSIKDTASESRNTAAKALQNIIDELIAKDIPKENITTNYFRIGPEKEWNDKKRKMELIGFKTTNSVKVKIYELDKVGEIIDVIIINSDELIDFESITFDLEDKTSIIKSAREIAVKNAMEKAQEIASTANIKLGNPKYINEISSPNAFESVSDMPMMAMARAESFIETPIMSGDISVSVQVQMHFDINDN